MLNSKLDLLQDKVQPETQVESTEAGEQLIWETPKMEDVSEQVMAQPYIRYT